MIDYFMNQQIRFTYVPQMLCTLSITTMERRWFAG